MHPYRLSFLFALFCMVVFALTNGAMAYLIGPAIKMLFAAEANETTRFIPFDLLTLDDKTKILAIPIALVVVAVIKGLSYYGNTYYMGYVGQRVVTDLRRKLYEHILRLPVGYFSSNPSACRRDSKHGLEARPYLGRSLPLDRLAHDKVRKEGQEHIEKGAGHDGCAYLAPSRGHRGGEDSKGLRYGRVRVGEIKVRAISSPLIEVLGTVGFAATIWYAAYRITSGTLKPEDFISFFAAAVMLYQPIRTLNGVHLNLQQGMAAATRVFEVMDTPGEPREEQAEERNSGV
jgi:ABC-type multidrug transport system fused ATPase/permease subunit